MKLTFFEKNILDPSSREITTISTEDTGSDDITKIKSDFIEEYLSGEGHRSFQNINLDFLYLPFVKGIQASGEIRKVKVQSGEPSITYNVVHASEDRQIMTEYSAKVNKLKLDEDLEEDGEDIVVDTDFSSEEFTLPQTTFDPVLNFQVGTLTTNLLNGISDFSASLRKLTDNKNTIQTNKLIAFNDLMNSKLRAFSSEFVLNWDDDPDFSNIDPIYTKDEYIRTVELNNSSTMVTLNARVSWWKVPIPITVPLNVTYDLIQETKVYPLSLMKTNSGYRLGFPTEQILKVDNLEITYDENSSSARDFIDNMHDHFINNLIDTYKEFPIGSEQDPNDPSVTEHRYTGALKKSALPPDYNSGDSSPIISWADFIGVFKSNFNFFNGEGVPDTYIPVFHRRIITEDGSDPLLDMVSRNENDYKESLKFRLENHRHSFLIFQPLVQDIMLSIQSPLDNITTDNRDAIFNSITIPNEFQTNTIKPSNLNYLGAIQLNGTEIHTGATNTAFILNKQSTLAQEAGKTIEGTKQRRKFGYFPLGANFNLDSLPLVIENPRDLATINDILGISPIVFDSPDLSYSLNAITNYDPSIPSAEFTIVARDTDNNVIADAPTPRFLLKSNRQVGSSTYLGQNELTGVFDTSLATNFFDNRSLTFDDFKLISSTLQSDFRDALTIPQETFTLEIINEGAITSFALSQAKEDAAEARRREEDSLTESLPNDLLENIPDDFPFVSLNQLRHRNGVLKMFLSRKSEDAPHPSPLFFDSVKIGNKTLNFSDASVKTHDIDEDDNPFPTSNVTEYSWGSTSDPTLNRTIFDIIFKKSATSKGSSITHNNLVQKSTIETIEDKEFPNFINGFEISDFDFDTTMFKIEFVGKVLATDFDAIRVLSKDKDYKITRDLIGSDAVRVETTGKTTFTWSNLPEFYSLRPNKDYNLEIVKDKTSEELEFFFPRPAKALSVFPSLIKDGEDLKLTLKPNSVDLPNHPFNSLTINNSDDSNFITPLERVDSIQDNNCFTFVDALSGKSLSSGSSYKCLLDIERLTEFNISFLKMTDIYFDTVILLNTNIKDFNLVNSLEDELIHPSDIEKIIEVEEDGLRHTALFLKNPITSPEVILKTFHTIKEEGVRKLGQVLLLKKIGSFEDYPYVRPRIEKAKVRTKDQFNKSYVRNQLESIDYHISIPPIDDQKTLLLIQDLFSRTSDYNEFVIWASGGEQPKKIKAMKGFRFVDLIKSLCVNEFKFEFKGGRFSSGVELEMEVVEVS